MRLGDYTNIKTGKLDANASSENGEYPFFTCSKNPLRISSYSYECECVLVAGNGDLNTKYYNGKFDAYQRTYIIESKTKEELSVRYLYYFLDKYVEILREQSIGGVIKYIKLGNLTEALLPLPPLQTQQKIAEVLDKASSLIEKRKAQIAKLDLLVKSQFIEMFGDPVTNPMGWDVNDLGNLCFSIKDGPHVSPQYTDSGIPFISVNNIVKKNWNFQSVKYISEEDYEKYSKKCKPEYGDVLYTKGGTTGIAKYVDIDFSFMNWVHIAVLKFDKKIVNGVFLEHMLNSSYCYAQSQQYTRGIANRDLVLGQMCKIHLYIPPLDLQNRFTEFVKAADKSKFEMRRQLKKMERNYQSLMQKCFLGEIF